MSGLQQVVALRGLIAQLQDAKQRATQVGMRSDVLQLGNVDPTSEVAFDGLVTDLYRFWHEAIASEIRYLSDEGNLDNQGRRAIRLFDRTIRLLRTGAQHSDSDEAVRFSTDWRQNACGEASPTSVAQWQACGIALLGQFVDGLVVLRDAAMTIASDEEASGRWAHHEQAMRAVDPRNLRDQIANDLGMNLSLGAKGHIDRAVEYQTLRRRLTVEDDPGSVLESIVERELLAYGLIRLPCSYQEVLNRLDTWGSDAFACLCIAHGVAAREFGWTEVSDFLDRVEAVWSALLE